MSLRSQYNEQVGPFFHEFKLRIIDEVKTKLCCNGIQHNGIRIPVQLLPYLSALYFASVFNFTFSSIIVRYINVAICDLDQDVGTVHGIR